jgi:hypothetical protein
MTKYKSQLSHRIPRTFTEAKKLGYTETDIDPLGKDSADAMELVHLTTGASARGTATRGEVGRVFDVRRVQSGPHTVIVYGYDPATGEYTKKLGIEYD